MLKYVIYLQLLILLNFIGHLQGKTSYHCISYGQCHQTETGLYQNCVYEGPPKPLSHNASALEILHKRCPHLVTSDPLLLCCDADQLFTLEEDLRTTEVVYKRCTSCLKNLGRQICDYTCARDQSAYITISSTGLDLATMRRYVTGLYIYVSTKHMYDTYKSCSGVVMPSTGRLVLDAACGVYDAEHCTPERWYEFVGDINQNPYTPYNIEYKKLDEPFLNKIPYNVTAVPCNEAFDNGSTPCSCVDCEKSCPVGYGVYTNETNHLQIFGFSLYTVSCFIIYTLGIAVWILSRVYLRRSKRKKEYSSDTSSVDSQNETNCLDEFGDSMDAALTKFFTSWGKVVSSHAVIVLSICSWVIVAMSHGVMFLTITTDPVKLWSSPNSQTRQEKDYFDSRFQPFYRTEQVCIRAVGLPHIKHNTSNGIIEFGPAYNKEFLLAVFELQQQILNLTGLEDICFAPLSTTKSGKAIKLEQCVVQSVWGYFQNDLKKFNSTKLDSKGYNKTYLDQLSVCLLNSYSPDCMAPYGGNIEPALAFGRLTGNSSDYRTASSVFLTFIVNNHLNKDDLTPAETWEHKFLNLLKNWTREKKPDFMDVAYRAERSIEDELERESKAEIWTVVLSYILMFVYVTIGLGTYRSFTYVLIDSKFSMGVFGVVLVFLSVLSAMGICCYIRLPTTLLVLEVIPFLILAVGVDNIFIIVQAEQRLRWKPRETPEEHIGRTLGKVAPSILVSSLSEAACFAIGTLTEVPAVQTFAIYATIAIVVNFILQITAFIALMVLDSRRQNNNRLDVLCCWKMKTDGTSVHQHLERRKWVYVLFQKYYKTLTKNYYVRCGVILFFWTLLCTGLITLPNIDVGLDQELSMPEDSYMVKYFQFLKEDFTMGPPVYFVLKNGLNMSENGMQNLVCSGLHCNSDSLGTQIYMASKYPDSSYIARPASSWIDDYLDWATVPGCCKYYKSNGTYCPHDVTSDECKDCNITVDKNGRPDEISFQKYLPYFLMDNPDMGCAKGGHAAYNGGVNYGLDNKGVAKAEDSYFMAYHSALHSSSDYTSALRLSREIAKNITKTIQSRIKDDTKSVEVISYSIFYVFYEQYLNIWEVTMLSLGLSLLAVFVVMCLLTGFDILSTVIVTVTVFAIIINLLSLMYWWNISLNAVSLLNLVVAVGISVEFCSHIMNAFNSSLANTKQQRSIEALMTMGTSVFSGITLTKLIGIIVLGFAKTQIFRVFYFRMYLGMIIFGAAHSLILLPILLSIIGPDNSGRRLLKLQRLSEPHTDL